jgi:hypothetical protein
MVKDLAVVAYVEGTYDAETFYGRAALKQALDFVRAEYCDIKQRTAHIDIECVSEILFIRDGIAGFLSNAEIRQSMEEQLAEKIEDMYAEERGSGESYSDHIYENRKERSI